jgi:hypothetical protein
MQGLFISLETRIQTEHACTVLHGFQDVNREGKNRILSVSRAQLHIYIGYFRIVVILLGDTNIVLYPYGDFMLKHSSLRKQHLMEGRIDDSG